MKTLLGLTVLALTLSPAFADEPKKENNEMPMGKGYSHKGSAMKGPGYKKTAGVRAAAPGKSKAAAAKAMPRGRYK